MTAAIASRKVWSDDEVEQVRGLLTQFSTSEEVCAVLECDPDELDGLCMAAFGADYKATEAKFAAQGRALLRQMQFQLALNGDRNMLQVLGREQLGQESAAYHPKKDKKPPADPDEDAERERAENRKKLMLLKSKYQPPKAAATV